MNGAGCDPTTAEIARLLRETADDELDDELDELLDVLPRKIARARRRHSNTAPRSDARCNYKATYPTKTAAKRALDRCKALGWSQRSAYHCPHCDAFHLTSQITYDRKNK